MQSRTKPHLPDAARIFDDLPDDAMVGVGTVAAIHDVGPATIWRWAKAGTIPSPEKIGPNTTRWSVGKLRRHRAQSQGAV